MAELVYPPVVLAAKTAFRLLDLRIRLEGAHHVPRRGGAVLASNHVSYLDFLFCGLGAQASRRLVRFLAKREVYANRVAGPLMRAMRHIEVDRAAGAAAYAQAVDALRRGEVIGVFPEGTISRSLTVKAFKTGPARMAAQAGVPLVPMAVWGAQRLWTKGRPRTLTRRHVPICILIGEPIAVAADEDPAAVTQTLRQAVSALVRRAQDEYPDRPVHAEDAWWLPAHLGGTAPTPEQALVLDAAARDHSAPR